MVSGSQGLATNWEGERVSAAAIMAWLFIPFPADVNKGVMSTFRGWVLPHRSHMRHPLLQTEGPISPNRALLEPTKINNILILPFLPETQCGIHVAHNTHFIYTQGQIKQE